MNTLQEVLSHVEGFRSSNDETEVSTALKELLAEGESATGELLYELLAFGFGEYNQDDELEWGTYYGPGFMQYTKEGILATPDIRLVTEDAINYWRKRVDETTNPLLKSRYAGLIWDFTKKALGAKPDFNYAIIYVENLMLLYNSGVYKHEIELVHKMQRALSVALGLNQGTLIDAIKKIIIELEDRMAEDSLPGTWGFSFDNLIDKRKITISGEEHDKIIGDLEKRLQILTSTESVNSHAAKSAATRLADYYQAKSRPEEKKRVMLELKKAYESEATDENMLNKSAKLEELHRLYVHYNLLEEADSILMEIRRIGPEMAKELKSFSKSVNIPQEEIDKFLNGILNGDVKEVLFRIYFYFTPNRESTQKALEEIARQSPFQFMIGTNIIDDRGRSIAKIGSIMNDLDGHIINHMSKSMSFSSMWLNLSIRKTIEKFKITSEKFVEDFIGVSPIFDNAKFGIISRALDAYWNEDYQLFIHFIIPQIEEAFRTMLEKMGSQVLKPNRGAFQLKTFGELLQDEAISRVFSEDFALYCRVMFTEARGWNMRNNLCHGLLSEEKMGVIFADRLFHILISLSFVETTSNPVQPSV